MKKRLFVIPTVIAFVLGITALTACNKHHHDPEDKVEWMVHKISKKLDLDDGQKAKLEDVKVELMMHHNQHKTEKAESMERLIRELKKPEIDQALLLDFVNQHTTRVEQAAPAVIEKLAIFHASLTAEQKQELVEKLQKFKKRHHNQDS